MARLRFSIVDSVLRVFQSPFAAALIFMVAGLLVYAPALNGELIWDDEYLVGQNPFFKSPVFALEVFQHYLFFDSFSIYYRPVQNLSYMIDYWLWAGNPFGYHLTNVIVHALSGFLLFRVLRWLLPGLLGGAADKRPALSESIALLVALIWTVHPIHNAGVAYIAGRADSLASLFALTAWLITLRLPTVAKPWHRFALTFLAVVSILLALCSKEIALMWLVLFLLHLFCFKTEQIWRTRLAIFAGLLAVFGIYYWLHSLPAPRARMVDAPPAPMAARFLLMLRALGDYTGLIFYPSRLLMDRTLTSTAMYNDIASWYLCLRYEYLSVVGSAALVAGGFLCRSRAAGQRLRVFGALWFLIAFLPISNLFPLNAEVAEHWIYLASIGYLSLIAGCVLMLSERGRQIAVGVAAVAVLALGVRTSFRAYDWSDPERFFLSTIDAGGGPPRIAGNLAAVYAKRGEYAKQEKLLRKTLQMFPDFVSGRINLGICLTKQGRPEEAEEFLNFSKPMAEQVSHQFPRTWSAALNLAGLRVKAGKKEEARAILTEARARFPDTWELAKYEAEVVESMEGPAAAIPPIESYAAAHWWHEDAWLTLGQLRSLAGDGEQAISAMRAASRLDIYNAIPFANIARMELARNRPEAAAQAQIAAIKRDPSQPSRYLVLADILKSLGREAEAAEALRHAEELRASVSAQHS